MYTYNSKIEWMALLLLGLLIGSAICTPMYYKKTDEETYEPDLVPVSSTVIPLYSYHVNSTGAAIHHALPLDEEEYRIAYMKLMHKKHKLAAAQDDPDTLITITKKFHPEKKIKVSSEHVAVVNSA